MRRIANLFLILILLTAALNLGNMLINFHWPNNLPNNLPNNPLARLSDLAELLLLLLAVPIYFGLGFNRHLAKGIFVPLLAYLLWGLLDFWPLEYLSGSHYRFYAAIGQLLLGVLVLIAIRRKNGESLLLTRSQFTGSGFRGPHLLRFCLIGLPLLPVILLLLGYAAADTLIEKQTAGFIRLKPNGLYMVEKTYVQGAKEIRLAGMIHLGQKDYYQQLSDSFKSGHSLLLAEGVSDAQGLLKSRFSYGKLAGLLGLSSQGQFRFPGRRIEVAMLDQPSADTTDTPDILRADIDLQEFDPRTIAVLDAIGTTLLNSSSLRSGYHKFSQWAAQHITPQTNRIVMNDLLLKRNRALLSYLPKALKKYRILLIPWGALHMPGIEAAVKARGFVLHGSRQRLSIDFFTLPYRRLWENREGKAQKAADGSAS